MTSPTLTAGFKWQPEMCPMANAMVSTVSPKARATPTNPMPTVGKPAASTAAPHPPNTSQNVPKNSAAARLPIGMGDLLALQVWKACSFPGCCEARRVAQGNGNQKSLSRPMSCSGYAACDAEPDYCSARCCWCVEFQDQMTRRGQPDGSQLSRNNHDGSPHAVARETDAAADPAADAGHGVQLAALSSSGACAAYLSRG